MADLDLDALALLAVVVLKDSVFERLASLSALEGENPRPKRAASPGTSDPTSPKKPDLRPKVAARLK